MSIFTKLFGTKNDRDIKTLQPLVQQVSSLEGRAKQMKDEDFPKETEALKARVKAGESLDSLMCWAFAVAREAAFRVLGERPYDVQVMGAIVLHQGKILEMKTGEGKTLTSTMPAYLNALEGKGVHIVTVNDYLAQRDSEWMGRVYRFLGLSVGVILSSMDNESRRVAYSSDITYGTNNELGFDYLRDNMKYRTEDKLQVGHHYCIIDEIDSILIDEARTPLIISGQGEDDSQKAKNAERITGFFRECPKDPATGEYPETTILDRFDKDAPQVDEGDYKLDEKSKKVSFTKDGMEKMESLLQKNNIIKGSIYDDENFDYVHYVTQAMTARLCYKRDTDYIVQDNKIKIVDEFTGRILEGRRYSEGLHQAIEAKEHIKVYGINKTIATITLQNFFRMYEKISGMTGTADTEASEFLDIYNLDVVVIPTHLPVIREDLDDLVFLKEEYKLSAICKDIEETHAKGQPILVGTVSIEKSELISHLLTKMGIRHNVLNAKNHAREALIIEEAGSKGAVTIATNMAGRGTDIKLGGSLEGLARKEVGSEADEKTLQDAMERLRPQWKKNYEEVKSLGGLYVLGTERHESRRIDNQLRGRSGRQGDPGKSRFYVSFEDNLMRLFAKENIQGMLGRLGMNDGEPIEHSLVSRVIENAQKKVEERNFDIRKHLLEYDNVLNEQREYIYSQRDAILSEKQMLSRLIQAKNDILDDLLADDEKLSGKALVNDVYEKLKNELRLLYPFTAEDEKLTEPDLAKKISQSFEENLKSKQTMLGEEVFNGLSRQIYLFEIDKRWQDHLDQLTELMDSVRLRTYAQKNPLVEYKLEGFDIFDEMLENIRKSVLTRMLIVRIKARDTAAQPKQENLVTNHGPMNQLEGRDKAPAVESRQAQTVVRTQPKIGRNDPCPCGSGKKYKNCCGRNL
ncbi:MAG: preprotein translocase subunit SecA [Sphaerochaetaceae bacterium]